METVATLTFRRATADDIPRLRELAEKIWRTSYAEMITARQMDYMLGWMYSAVKIEEELSAGVGWEVAALEDRAVGYLACTAEPSASRLKLDKLYLLPELQGRGFGQQMLARVFQIADAFGTREVWLQVNKRNARAIRSYERAGFRIERSAVFDIGEGFAMDDFIMVRDLPSPLSA
jgi:diamine N-acetyltransferase